MSDYSARELAEGVSARLAAQGVPIAAYFGKRRLTAELNTANEVRFTEVPGADAFEDAPQAGGNPRPMCMRTATIKAEIRGRSTAVGADPEKHRDVVRSLLHSVAAAVLYVARAQRIDMPTKSMSGGFVDAELAETEHGAKYELTYHLAETIFDVAWAERSGPVGHAVPDVMLIDGTEHAVC